MKWDASQFQLKFLKDVLAQNGIECGPKDKRSLVEKKVLPYAAELKPRNRDDLLKKFQTLYDEQLLEESKGSEAVVLTETKGIDSPAKEEIKDPTAAALKSKKKSDTVEKVDKREKNPTDQKSKAPTGASTVKEEALIPPRTTNKSALPQSSSSIIDGKDKPPAKKLKTRDLEPEKVEEPNSTSTKGSAIGGGVDRLQINRKKLNLTTEIGGSDIPRYLWGRTCLDRPLAKLTTTSNDATDKDIDSHGWNGFNGQDGLSLIGDGYNSSDGD